MAISYELSEDLALQREMPGVDSFFVQFVEIKIKSTSL